jgi:RNA polymerase sigma-70 factor (ECF subfamily)
VPSPSEAPSHSPPVARSAQPDAAIRALGEMYEAHSERVYRAAHRITGNPMDAEDVLQSVFLKLARRSGDPLSGDEAVGYFYRSAVNAALDVVRSRQRAGWAPLEDLDGSNRDAAGRVNRAERDGAEFEPEREHRLKQLRKALRLAISRLSPRSAEVFTLRYFEGMSYQQIAEVTGHSSGLVAVLLHRTRARLRKELTSYGSIVGELS